MRDQRISHILHSKCLCVMSMYVIIWLINIKIDLFAFLCVFALFWFTLYFDLVGFWLWIRVSTLWELATTCMQLQHIIVYKLTFLCFKFVANPNSFFFCKDYIMFKSLLITLYWVFLFYSLPLLRRSSIFVVRSACAPNMHDLHVAKVQLPHVFICWHEKGRK